MSVWDPMKEQYFSKRNAYSVDVNDPAVAMLGYGELFYIMSLLNDRGFSLKSQYTNTNKYTNTNTLIRCLCFCTGQTRSQVLFSFFLNTIDKPRFGVLLVKKNQNVNFC